MIVAAILLLVLALLFPNLTAALIQLILGLALMGFILFLFAGAGLLIYGSLAS